VQQQQQSAGERSQAAAVTILLKWFYDIFISAVKGAVRFFY
jgi:hypothetical protein